MKPISRVAITVATLVIGGTCAAHHSAAMFDADKCLSIKGSVRNFEWQNPHSWLWIIVTNGKAGEDIWGFEFPSPSQLVSLDPRWSRTVVAKGDKVVVSYSPLKDGRHGGLLNAVTLPDGKTLHGAPNAVGCESKNWQKK
jgi:hypothetical protein